MAPDIRAGMASRQAWVASASATSKAPFAMQPVAGRDADDPAGTPAAAAAPQTAAVSCGFTAADHD